MKEDGACVRLNEGDPQMTIASTLLTVCLALNDHPVNNGYRGVEIASTKELAKATAEICKADGTNCRQQSIFKLLTPTNAAVTNGKKTVFSGSNNYVLQDVVLDTNPPNLKLAAEDENKHQATVTFNFAVSGNTELLGQKFFVSFENEELAVTDITDENKPKKQACPNRSATNIEHSSTGFSLDPALAELAKSNPELAKINAEFLQEFYQVRGGIIPFDPSLLRFAQQHNLLQSKIGMNTREFGQHRGVVGSGSHTVREFVHSLSQNRYTMEILDGAKMYAIDKWEKIEGDDVIIFWTLVVE